MGAWKGTWFELTLSNVLSIEGAAAYPRLIPAEKGHRVRQLLCGVRGRGGCAGEQRRSHDQPEGAQ